MRDEQVRIARMSGQRPFNQRHGFIVPVQRLQGIHAVAVTTRGRVKGIQHRHQQFQHLFVAPKFAQQLGSGQPKQGICIVSQQCIFHISNAPNADLTDGLATLYHVTDM